MKKKSKDARLVIADLSQNAGGAAHLFHKSHQTGRDVDILYYVRDALGNAFEPDAMHVFNRKLVAVDGSGITLDVPRTWALVRELLTAREAYVQYIFMYAPIAEKLIDYAKAHDESETVIARAMKTLKQPGDSAPHNDHLHVRIYCPENDRVYGCVDIGPLEMLAEREAEAQQTVAAIAGALPPASQDELADSDEPRPRTAADVWNEAAAKSSSSSAASSSSSSSSASLAASVSSTDSFGTLLRASSHRIDLRGWR
jgi:penicillin-insensitive murein endopeptidase